MTAAEYIAEFDCLVERYFEESERALQNQASTPRADEIDFLREFVRSRAASDDRHVDELALLRPPSQLEELHDDYLRAARETRDYWRSLEPRVGQEPTEELFAERNEAELGPSDELDAIQARASELGAVSDLECDK